MIISIMQLIVIISEHQDVDDNKHDNNVMRMYIRPS